jgi:hypothetical protein
MTGQHGFGLVDTAVSAVLARDVQPAALRFRTDGGIIPAFEEERPSASDRPLVRLHGAGLQRDDS